jgi:ABC-2 type transport system permease protein
MLKASFNSHIQSEKRSKLFWALTDSWVLARRSIKHITRNLDQLFSVALFPMMFFLLFRYVFGGAIDTGDISYVNFLVAGIFVQMLAFGANYTTMNLAIDLQRGIVNRFRSLPIARSALLIGHVGADLVRNTISGLIVIGVSFLVRFSTCCKSYRMDISIRTCNPIFTCHFLDIGYYGFACQKYGSSTVDGLYCYISTDLCKQCLCTN